MPLNDPSASQTDARAPLLRVLSNGQPLPGILSVEVVSNNYYQCDRFTITAAFNAGTAGWWDMQPPWVVEVDISADTPGWTPLITGEVDHITVQQQTGLLTLDGRDLSARLIEAKTQKSYVNQTSSEVATALAAEHGLTAQVTATSTLIGRYYKQDHVKTPNDQLSRAQTEWDLLVFLAQQEGFDVFVKGTTLYFQPSTPPNADPYVIRWQPPSPVARMNAVTLRMERSLTLAKDVQVSVRSWNSHTERGFTKVVKAIGGRPASAAGVTPGGKTNTTQNYTFVRPNLTEDQALKLALQLAKEITQHERVVEIDIPGELELTPRNMVRLEGSASSFDQAYYIASITRSLSFEEGFRQSIRCKNSSPRSQTTVQ